MNKQKFMKWALPALLMSGVVFEFMPGSVQYYAKDLVADPEAAWNFFSPPVQSTAASCLGAAGVVTLAAMVLALVAACSKKHGLYKLIAWCCLGGGALAAVPYITAADGELLQPNVVVLLILVVSWLLSLALDKQGAQDQAATEGRRLEKH